MLYVGLDVHRRRTQVAVMDEGGHELFNRNVPNDPARLSEVLCGAEPGTPVVFEAAYGWSWLAELLQDMGMDVHLAHARSCKAIAYARLKNDRVDARTLAHLLRTDLLPEAWIAPRPVKELPHGAPSPRFARTPAHLLGEPGQGRARRPGHRCSGRALGRPRAPVAGPGGPPGRRAPSGRGHLRRSSTPLSCPSPASSAR